MNHSARLKELGSSEGWNLRFYQRLAVADIRCFKNIDRVTPERPFG